MKKLFSEIPFLQREHLTLKKLTEEDAEGLQESKCVNMNFYKIAQE